MISEFIEHPGFKTMATDHDLVREIMQAIHQTDEWDRIWKQDLEIQAARSHLEAVMEPIESKELRDNLLDATFVLTTACESAAIRYGAHVTLALLNAISQP